MSTKGFEEFIKATLNDTEFWERLKSNHGSLLSQLSEYDAANEPEDAPASSDQK